MNYQFIKRYFCCLLLLTSPLIVNAETIYVGSSQTYKTITAAISAADSGDIIIVKDGTYDESFTIDKSITVKSENEHGAAIGDGIGPEGVVLIGKFGGVRHVTLEGFTFGTLKGLGILVGDANNFLTVTDCTIKNNYIHDRNYGILITPNSTHCTIFGNQIESNARFGMTVSGKGTITIKNNIFQDHENRSAMRISHDRNATVNLQNNSILNIGSAGVQIYASNVNITGNLFEGNRHAGVYIDSNLTNIVIKDENQFYQNGNCGIFAKNGTEVTIENNTITENTNAGISCMGQATISDNLIDQNTGHGMIISEESTVTNNTISNNGNSGIYTSDGNFVINNNQILNNTDCGIIVRCPTSLQNNTIDGNGGAGIEISGDSVKVEVCSNNTISNNGGTGIHIGGIAELKSNHITNNGAGDEYNIQNGVVIGGTATLKSNVIEDHQGAGIEILDGANNVTLDNNQIMNNFQGIFSRSGAQDVLIINNDINENQIGIIANSPLKLRSNWIESNTEVGVEVNDSAIDLGQNSDSEAGKNAIRYNEEWNIKNRVSGSVSAYRNYWEFSDADSIDATIEDDDEDNSLGKVNYNPFLTEDPTPVKYNTDRYNYPENFVLLPAYPNPFNPETTIQYSLPEACNVQLTIFNVRGEKIQTLINSHMNAGLQSVRWQGMNDFGEEISSGIYLYHLQAGKFQQTRKLLLMR